MCLGLSVGMWQLLGRTTTVRLVLASLLYVPLHIATALISTRLKVTLSIHNSTAFSSTVHDEHTTAFSLNQPSPSFFSFYCFSSLTHKVMDRGGSVCIHSFGAAFGAGFVWGLRGKKSTPKTRVTTSKTAQLTSLLGQLYTIVFIVNHILSLSFQVRFKVSKT